MSPHGAAFDKRLQLSAELRLLREANGISGRELARRIGVSQSKLSRIELGAVLPSTGEVTAWAEAVGASAAQAEALSSMLTDVVRTEAEEAIAKSMTGSAGQVLFELLHTAVIQLGNRMSRIRQVGVRADDLPWVADYVCELAEHGRDVAKLALDAIDEGGDVEVYLGHTKALMEAAQTFAADSYVLLSKQHRSRPE